MCSLKKQVDTLIFYKITEPLSKKSGWIQKSQVTLITALDSDVLLFIFFNKIIINKNILFYTRNFKLYYKIPLRISVESSEQTMKT